MAATASAATEAGLSSVELQAGPASANEALNQYPRQTLPEYHASGDGSGVPADLTRDQVPNDGKLVVNPYFDTKKQDFYSSRPGLFEQAMDDISTNFHDPEVDGLILDSWLLLEVDHWDNETEKIVLLTEESLLTVRYDFVPMKIYRTKRVPLKDIDTIASGPFTYPKVSLCNMTTDLARRSCDGVRLMWNKGESPSFFSNWNPVSSNIPWQTFTYHPLYQTSELDKYNVKDLQKKVIEAVNKCYEKHSLAGTLVVKEEPLEQHIYVGLTSQIHNQSFIGMSKERGGVSF